jgi:peptidoglycan/xylan/chitin deacetylase (PgdA/CDA1 family)
MNWKYRVWKGVAAAYALVNAAPSAVRPGLRILCYHAVGTQLPGDPYGLSVPLASFQAQMKLLASGRFGRVVSLAQARLDEPAPQVCLTFDDGYRDTLTTAAPMLADLGLAFTVCVTPKFIESGDQRYLSAAQLQELSATPGAEIGAHGMNHLRLADCDAAALDQELSGSRTWLEDRLGKPVGVMTYPHGSTDRRVAQAAVRAGYARAGCSRYGLNTAQRDPLLLCRTEIVAWDDEATFIQKTLGGWDWYSLRHKDPSS